MCGEFADEAVAQMLCTVLPEETAMVRVLTGLSSSLTHRLPGMDTDSVVQQEQSDCEDMPRVSEVIPVR